MLNAGKEFLHAVMRKDLQKHVSLATPAQHDRGALMGRASRDARAHSVNRNCLLHDHRQEIIGETVGPQLLSVRVFSHFFHTLSR